MELTQFEQGLLDSFQYHFPLVDRPFDNIARVIGLRESQVLKQTKQLFRKGIISRIGPVFSANSVGANMLAVMSVPDIELEQVASQVCLFDEVTHCYEREHTFNLWFVISSHSDEALHLALTVIEDKLKRKLVRLPMQHDYKAVIGACRNFGEPIGVGMKNVVSLDTVRSKSLGHYATTEIEQKVIQIIQAGIPVCENPYDELGKRLGMTGQEFIRVIQLMHHHGLLNRWGVVLRYYELGFKANAVVVWDIPDEKLEGIAQKIASVNTVSMCFRRPRCSSGWRFNLFTEVNSKTSLAIHQEIASIVKRFDLQDIEHDILFNGRRFKHPNSKLPKMQRNLAAGEGLNNSKR